MVLAKDHDPDASFRVRTVSDIGKTLSLVILCEIDDISRFPPVQDFASCRRLVKPAPEPGAKRIGSDGAMIGNVTERHGKAKSLSILAHKITGAVNYILRRWTVFGAEAFFA